QNNRLFTFKLVFLLLWLLLTACSRGPDKDILRQELQTRLDNEFSAGLFNIHKFKRAGSAPFRNLEQGISGVLIYYDAEFEFLRDYSLTSWKGLNLGSLTHITGSTKEGISGLKPNGNQQGDILKVYGRLAYSDETGQWQVLADGKPPLSAEVPKPQTLEGQSPTKVLKDIRALLHREPEAQPETRDATILKELSESVQRLDLIFARQLDELIFASGQELGTYHEFGQLFSDYSTEHKLAMHNAVSEGSIENVHRVQNYLADFALIQSDVAETLYKGWMELQQFPNSNLRSMASLWPEAVHIVVLQGSGINTLKDLHGKRIAVGTPGSGSRFNAIRIAQVAGVSPVQFPEIHETGIAESIAALEAGQVDAIFITEAVPSVALQQLSSRRDDIRFLSIEGDLIKTLSRQQFAYYPLTVPVRTYPGQSEPFTTLGLTALLITHKRTTDAAVEKVLEMLLDSRNELAKKYYRAGFISGATMRLGIAVPLHPGAVKFYANHKHLLDKDSK
ncbi:MAG: hypothetical protein DRQ62_07510, partial [Gammaproteobacteria bacterium]